MSKFSIDTVATIPGERHIKTSTYATQEQVAAVVVSCAKALESLGTVRQYVELIKVVFVYIPGERWGPKDIFCFQVHAVINGPEKRETDKVKVGISGDILEKPDFSQDLRDVIVQAIKKSLLEMSVELETWKGTFEPLDL